MKQLENMTRKQIEQWLKENNIKVNKAYKMSKAELIAAIERGFENEELFNPSKKYTFSKEKYLQHIKKISGERVLNNVLQDAEIMGWLNRIDGEEVKQNFDCWNSVYVEDKDETFERHMCDEVIDEQIQDEKIKEELTEAFESLGKEEFEGYIDWTAKEVMRANDNLKTIKSVCTNQDEIKKYEDILREKQRLRDLAIQVYEEQTKISKIAV